MSNSRTKKDGGAEGGFRQSWEFRSAKMVLRIAAVLFFLAYLMISTPLAMGWGRVLWVRHYPPAAVTGVVERWLEQKNAPEKVRGWLGMREPHEVDELIRLLKPHMGRLDGITFIIFSDWMLRQGRVEEALFWRQYARFRIHYDVLRCGSREAIDIMQEVLNVFPRAEIQSLLVRNPKLITKSLRDVLDYDRAHPAVNDPYTFCKGMVEKSRAEEGVLRVMVPKAEWPEYRLTLRVMTKVLIENLEEEQAKRDAAGAAPPEPKPDAPKTDVPKPDKTGKKHKP